MAKTNKKTVALWVLSALALVSCGGRKSKQQYDPQQAEKARQEVVEQQKLKQAQRTLDSLQAKYDSVGRVISGFHVPYEEIEKLENSKTLGGAMERELFNVARPIIMETEGKIAQMFQDNGWPEYVGNIDCDNRDDMLREIFHDRVQNSDSLKKLEFYKDWDAWLNGAESDISWVSTADTLMEQTAKNNAAQLISNAHKKLDAAATKSEQDWQNFYASAPDGVRKNPAMVLTWSNEADLGYMWLNPYQDTVRVEKDTLTLHIGGVNADITWFLDKGAVYEPVAEGNKWTIKKIIDGKVTETQSVLDSAANWSHIATFVPKTDTIPQINSKSCRPSFAEGGGVNISFDKITHIIPSQVFNAELYSEAEQHALDSMYNAIDYYEALKAQQQVLSQQKQAAKKHLDSLAK